MKKFIIDIETSVDDRLLSIYTQNLKAPKNIKDEKKIEEVLSKKRDEAEKAVKVDTDFADILCIGVKEIGGEAKLYTPKELEKFFADNTSNSEFGNNYNFQFITYNGKVFDIPLLMKTGIKQGFIYPYKLLKEMTNRYKNNMHIDLMIEIGEFGKYKTLDTMLQIYCGIEKTPINFNTASNDEIKKHCLEDLINTEKLYNKFKSYFN